MSESMLNKLWFAFLYIVQYIAQYVVCFLNKNTGANHGTN